MQRDIIVKSRGLGGSSDLTLLAPIKPGFVESLESVTYKTRIKRVLETLHGARTASHEYATARLLSDSVERVGAIHSVRVAVFEPEDKVLLAVTFDGSWESYVRVLWDKVGTLLDLIFCGTVDYVTAYDHTFDEWMVWARRVQVETGFFYGPPDSTGRDVLYQRRVEQMRIRGGSDPSITELNELRAVLPTAEEAMQRTVTGATTLPDDPPVRYPGDVRMVRERVRNGLQGLAGLYRLTDLHRPGTRDGNVLRCAALQLLLEFVKMHDDKLITKQLRDARTRFAKQLDWLFPDGEARAELVRALPPAAADRDPIDPAVRADIQGGILRAYENVSHGVLLFLAFDDAQGALEFFKAIQGLITTDAVADQSSPIYRNLGLTVHGLRAAGLTEDEVECFPEEFRQGMAARAGLLGDVHNNHPRRWRLPLRFAGVATPPGPEPIELETVHAILQLRCEAKTPAAMATIDLHEANHPLQSEVSGISAIPKLRILAVQSMRRNFRDQDGVPVIIEHFGYADGNGQPEVEEGPVRFDRNRINLGEIVHGHDNAVDFAVDPGDPGTPAEVRGRLWWLSNGSFLAMRKYRQYVSRLEKAVAGTSVEMEKVLGGKAADYVDVVYGKLMGRDRYGTPVVNPDLVDPARQNVFDYADDQQGNLCPLHAHIRRAHQRREPTGAERVPRLMRRSMSYGPRREADKGGPDADRGLVFMAYNADLGQQYEVVQRWLSGGNSTGSTSGVSCPIVGVPQNGVARHFRFEHARAGGKPHVFNVTLEDQPELLEAQPVLTQLEWGLYLLAPSITAMRRIQSAATKAAGSAPARPGPWRASRGRQLIAELRHIEATQGKTAAAESWKQVIEDPDAIERLDSAAVWASIREDHGGVLKTPYGTLVAGRELITQVLLDPGSRYSICGQFERMKLSIGEIFLGLDAGSRYDEEALPVNSAIGELTRTDAGREAVYQIAFNAAKSKIDAIVAEAVQQAKDARDTRYEVGFEAREIVDEVLAELCEAWFGLQETKNFQRGGSDWGWDESKPPIYPGHFTALSRYMFQPNPGALPAELAIRYGRSLRKAMTDFVAVHHKNGTRPKRADGSPAEIADAIFSHPLHGKDTDWVARTMVGVLMGFIAPIIGAVLNVLRELQRDGRFGALRAKLEGRSGFAIANSVVAAPMAKAARMRPMPQIIWRTATKPDRIGAPGGAAVDVQAGEIVVLALASGTQQSLADGKPDANLMFGGDRSALNHPTHACPGYSAGVAAMLGALTALLARTEYMRQGATPLTFLVEGPSGYSPPSPPASASPTVLAKDIAFDVKLAISVESFILANSVVKPKGTAPAATARVLGWGDSWLDYRDPIFGTTLGSDLRDCLEPRYRLPKDFCDWVTWTKIESMAANPAPFRRFLSNELQLRNPRAILLSGGGNDSTGDTMASLIFPKGSGKPTILDPQKLKSHISKLEAYYLTVLEAIAKEFKSQGKEIHVLVHGYDYPIPAGEGWYPWLGEPFARAGYDRHDPADLKLASRGMSELIDAFNEMLKLLKNRHAFVTHVELRGTIAGKWPTNPILGWANDLHPVDEAFKLLADKIYSKLEGLP